MIEGTMFVSVSTGQMVQRYNKKRTKTKNNHKKNTKSRRSQLVVNVSTAWMVLWASLGNRPLFIFGPRQYQTLIPHFPKCVCVCLCTINHILLKTGNILTAKKLKSITFNSRLSLFFFGPRQYQTLIPHFPKCVCVFVYYKPYIAENR